MTVLGISCWYHDAAAALVRDGVIVAAAQEERFTRRKHDPGFPARAIAYCLAEAGATAQELDAVAFYDKPFLKFERLLETYLAYAPRGWRSYLKAMPVWLKQKLWIPDLLAKELDFDGLLLFPEHHESHAASAFFPSSFERAAFLTTDGVGEWTTTSFGVGEGSGFEILGEIHFPHSLGLLYSAFTYFCGFRVNSGEYKLMGLAPYGTPRYAGLIRDELIDLKPDGSFKLNLDAFTFARGLTMTGRRFEQLFGGPRRAPEQRITQREMDLAASIQAVTEEAVLAMARHVRRETGARALCLAGGVALNCVANGVLLRDGVFDDLWIQPAAGDAGGALGAALAATYRYFETPRAPATDLFAAPYGSANAPARDYQFGTYLGPAVTEADCAAALEAEGLPYERFASDEALCARVAELLAGEQVVGWFQGRAEFGPRALGHRSILADPRGRDVQRRVNLKIKFRESFRPFAPSILAERASDVFDLDGDSPYMLLVANVRDAEIEGEGFERLGQIESGVPAVTHVDGSARVQTVHPDTSPLYHRLLSAFESRTGCPALVNTSFNVRGEPIVGSPADAIRVFRRTHLDALALGRCLVTKASLPEAQRAAFTPEEIAAEYGLD